MPKSPKRRQAPGFRQMSPARTRVASQVDVLSVAVAVTLAAVIVLFWRPAYDSFSLVKLTTMVVATLLIIAGVAIAALERGLVRMPRSPAAVLVGAFIGCGLVVTLLSSAPASSFIGEYGRNAGLIAYACAAILFFAVLRPGTSQRLPIIAWATIGASAVVVGYGLLQATHNDPFRWVGFGLNPRIATLGQPNFVAGYLGIAAPLLVWGALTRAAMWLRIASGVLAVAAVAVALGTDSFQGPVAIVAGLGLLAVAVLPRWIPRRWYRLGLVAVAGIVLVVAIAPPTRHAVQKQVRDGMEERRLLWQAGEDMVADRPIAGDGFGSYARYFSTYRSAKHVAYGGYDVADAPHDVPLAMAVNGGVLLLLPYLAFVGYTGWCLVRGLRRRTGEAQLLLAAFGGSWLAYQVQSLVSLDIPPLIALHFVIAGAIILLASDLEVIDVSVGPGAVRPRAARRQTRSARPEVRIAQAGVVVVLLVLAWFAFRPLRADAAAQSANHARRSNDLATALAESRTATELAPWEGTYWGLRAAALQNAGQASEAIEAGKKAARRTPSNIRYWLSVASLYEQEGDLRHAGQWYQLAAEHDPNNLDPTSAAVSFFLKTRDFAAASRLSRRFVSDNPKIADGWVLVARVELERARVRAARGAVDRALKVEPSNSDARAVLQTINTRTSQ